jgi:hypothetical protein
MVVFFRRQLETLIEANVFNENAVGIIRDELAKIEGARRHGE